MLCFAVLFFPTMSRSARLSQSVDCGFAKSACTNRIDEWPFSFPCLGGLDHSRYNPLIPRGFDFRRFAGATAIGLAVGILYALPLATHFGDALATVNSYHSKEWQGGWVFRFPF